MHLPTYALDSEMTGDLYKSLIVALDNKKKKKGQKIIAKLNQ